MTRKGRELDPGEAALWARVARTVRPLEPGRPARSATDVQAQPILAAPPGSAPDKPRASAGFAPPPAKRDEPRARPLDRHGLDAGWDRRLARGLVPPDFTLDLHGASLDAAHERLHHGLTQALAQGARVVLVITGRPRPSDDHAGRGSRRGAIRAKFLDWLHAGPHAGNIAAIRPAHPRHGGAGAVYLVLRRPR